MKTFAALICVWLVGWALFAFATVRDRAVLDSSECVAQRFSQGLSHVEALAECARLTGLSVREVEEALP